MLAEHIARGDYVTAPRTGRTGTAEMVGLTDSGVFVTMAEGWCAWFPCGTDVAAVRPAPSPERDFE